MATLVGSIRLVGIQLASWFVRLLRNFLLKGSCLHSLVEQSELSYLKLLILNALLILDPFLVAMLSTNA